MNLHGGHADGEQVEVERRPDGVVILDTDLDTGVQTETHYRTDSWGRLVAPTERGE